MAALLRVHFLFELLVVEWSGLAPAARGSPPRGGGGTADKEGAAAERGAAERGAAAHAAPMSDSLLLREWAMSEAEVTLTATLALAPHPSSTPTPDPYP